MEFSLGCRLPLFFTLLLITCANTSRAAESGGLSASAQAQLGQDNNVRRTQGALEQSDRFLLLQPKLAWSGLRSKHRLELSLDADVARFQHEDELDYSDHNAVATALLNHSHRLSSEFTLSTTDRHEAAGSNNATSFAAGEFNRYRNNRALAEITYGTRVSTGQIALSAEQVKRRHTNNDQGFRDYDLNQLSAAFYYRAAPKTRLTLETSLGMFDYVNSGGFGFNASNDDRSVLVGVEWRGTAQTTGTFKAGYQEKSYDDTSLGEISGLTLALDMLWRPTAATEVKLGASRSANESAIINTGGFIREFLRAKLRHQFGARTSLKANIGLGEEEFSFSADRTDKRYEFGVGLQRELAYRLTLACELLFDQRNSNQNQNDFNSRMLLISISSQIK
ncbi:MAG: outer membrane beta-barrel protein [Cellvibrionaceae bacterium]|nr:outer membrane beta-barrel protein [Cellvibrionaceae bacterium]